MIKYYFISFLLLLIGLNSFSQSYIGLGGGYYEPILKVSQPIPNHIFNSSIEANGQSSFFISASIKERSKKIFNKGIVLTYKHQLIKYSDLSSGGTYTKSNYFNNSNYQNHYINVLFNFELRVSKNIPIYFNFGPSIDFLVYSTNHKVGYNYETQYSSFNPPVITSSSSDEWNTTINNKDAKNIFSLVGGLSYEIKLTENIVISLNSRYNWALANVYEGVKVNALMFGGGIHYFLPHVTSTKWLKKQGTPYKLNE